MLAVQPGGLGGAEEELRAVGVGSSVGHRQDSGSCAVTIDESARGFLSKTRNIYERGLIIFRVKKTKITFTSIKLKIPLFIYL